MPFLRIEYISGHWVYHKRAYIGQRGGCPDEIGKRLVRVLETNAQWTATNEINQKHSGETVH